jgi:MarR-like DNA-binding transcriptional regulator SgrR of sgrS sRNA
MAYEAMFATISPFLVIYDKNNQSKHKFAKIDRIRTTSLAWMLTIIQTPPRSNFPLLIFSSYVHILPLWSHILGT